MANDFIPYDLDTNPGEPPRSLHNALKSLRQAREDLKKCRDWFLHSGTAPDTWASAETRFGLPAGTGGTVFTLLDGTLQALDGTTSGYANELMARLGNSES